MFFITPFLILMMTDRTKILKNITIALFVGAFSIVVQFCCAHFIGPETPAILGSVAAIIAMLIYNKLFIREGDATDVVKVEKKNFGLSKTLKAWSVYGLIIFFILISSKIVPPVNEALNGTLVSKFELPVIGNTFKFGWLSNAGLMIFLGAIIGGLIQGMSFGSCDHLLSGGYGYADEQYRYDQRHRQRPCAAHRLCLPVLRTTDRFYRNFRYG